MLRTDTERHFTPSVAPVLMIRRQLHAARQLKATAVIADAPFQQVHGRAADKARHKAAGWLLVHFHRGADLLGNAFVHHHHPLGEGHRLHLVMGDVQRGGFQAAMQLLQFQTHLHAQLGVEV